MRFSKRLAKLLLRAWLPVLQLESSRPLLDYCMLLFDPHAGQPLDLPEVLDHFVPIQ